MLFIRRLRIEVDTERGVVGCNFSFKDGLNVIRAENSMGKSTCARLIVYALGLDHIFGPSRRPPLPPAVTSEVEIKGQAIAVSSSRVYLCIQNSRAEHWTIRRGIRSEEADYLDAHHERVIERNAGERFEALVVAGVGVNSALGNLNCQLRHTKTSRCLG